MHKLLTFSLVALVGPVVAACASEKAPPHAAKDSATATTPALPAGEFRLAVDGGNIWYKVSGTNGSATPVILLHGGPGYGSFYLKPMEGLSADRPVVRYDQLGNGKSDRLTDTSKMNIAHFVAELEALRAKLGYEQVHIVGHSWGTILGYEYYKAHPTHVASLTLMSAALNIPAWEDNAKRLLKQLPDSSQRAIASAEKTSKFEGPAYEAANNEFMSRFVVRHIRQADWDSTTQTIGMEQYLYFQGPSEFTIIGTLKQYNVTSELKNITVPTLFTVGEFDEANPATIRKQAATVVGAKVAVIDTAAHLTMWDNEPQTLQAVRDFLKGVDAMPVKK